MGRTSRLKGLTPDGFSEPWAVSTVSRRFTNSEETADCAVTGETVRLDEPHYFVTIRRETGVHRPDEYEHLLVKDDRALEEFEENASG